MDVHLKFEVQMAKTAHYVKQQCGKRLIGRVRLMNQGGDNLRDVKVVINSSREKLVHKKEIFLSVLPAGQTVELKDAVEVLLNSEEMCNITDKVSTEMVFSVVKGEETIYSEAHQFDVMPMNYWENDPHFPEQLAAFSTPGHPMVPEVLKRAGEFLEKWTGSPSITGYQNPDRVKKLVEAICAALAEYNVTYSGPLIGHTERCGQFIRLIHDILNKKGSLSTCLDSTMLVCSCLEAADLYPVAILFDDHAIIAVHLKEEVLSRAVIEDGDAISKLLPCDLGSGSASNGALLPVETTALNAGHNYSFEGAVKSALNSLATKKFECAVDIVAARRAGVAPLPVYKDEQSGTYSMREVDPGSIDVAPAQDVPDITPDMGAPVVYTKREQWMRHLLSMDMRNALLNSTFGKNASIPLFCGNMPRLIRALMDGEEYELVAGEGENLPKTFVEMATFCGDDTLDLEQHRLRAPFSVDEVHKRAKELYKMRKVSLEEKGSNTLYLTLGWMRWYENMTERAEARFAPVLLYPVELIRSGARYSLRLSEEERPMLNMTLMEKMRQDFHAELPVWDTLPACGECVDIEKIMASLRHAVRDLPRWDVLKGVSLSNFAFADFVLWRDIRDNPEVLENNKVVASLMEGRQMWQSNDRLFVDGIPGDAKAMPVETDASQLLVIEVANSGESFVVHGPSGTGKSQCITGVVAEAIGEGKKVLFVAEKMAALEVVMARLKKMGLGDFCLEIHSAKGKLGQVLQQLDKVLQQAEEPEVQDETFVAKSSQMIQVKEDLDAYAAALHGKGRCGMSLYELISKYETVDEDQGCWFGPDDVGAVETMDAQVLNGQLDALNRLNTMAKVVGDPSDSAAGRMRGVEYSQKFKHKVLSAAKNYMGALDEVETAAHGFGENCGLPAAATYAELHAYAQLARSLQDLNTLGAGWNARETVQEMIVPLRTTAEICCRAESLKMRLLETWNEDFLKEDSGELIRQFNEMVGSSGLSRRLRLERLNRRLRPLSKGYVGPESLRGHLIKLQEYQNYCARADELLQQTSPVLRERFGEPPYDWEAIFATADKADAAKAKIRSLISEEGDAFCAACVGNDRCSEAAEAMMNAWEEVCAQRSGLYDMLGVRPTLLGDDWVKAEKERCRALSEQIDTLKDWANFNRLCDEVSAAGMGCVVKAYRKGEDPDKVNEAYRAALYRSLISQMIDESPVLSNFTGMVFDEQIETLRRLDKEMVQLAQKNVYNKAMSRVREVVSRAKLENNELSTLRKAIRSKGRGLTLRKLFEQNFSLISQLCPCMMMSPHSVAQYLPMENDLFDLVLFDEASQLPTSKAVGAMSRGKNAVIVGDCNQMPPTSFFTANLLDEANLETEDLESILDDSLAQGMPSAYLKWHYRSQHESLIAFSNNRFYDNKLLTFPSARDRNSHVHLHLVKDGVYGSGKTRQNPAEADAVIEYLRQHCRDEHKKELSVGLISFNVQQQKLLEEKLQEACREDEELRTWCDHVAEPMFIKNLENVQGDERDVILFSINYGPNAEGKVSTNFGPLNAEGGWRRLNVAITRARHEMHVFTSLVPEQIDLSRTSARGVHELRAFLEFAGGRQLPVDHSTLQLLDAPGGIAESLCDRLQKAGYETERNVGCSDLRVDVAVIHPDHPEQYIMGILLDGTSYAGAKTTRDRELTQTDVLRGLGWNIRRVWTLDWFDNREKELKRLLQELEALRAEK